MRKLHLSASCCLTFLLLSSIGFTQIIPVTNIDKKAKIAINNHSYKRASELLLESYRNDSTNLATVQSLGLVYVNLNDSKNAEYWLQKYVKLDTAASPRTYYLLAQQLSKNEKYDEIPSILEKLSPRFKASIERSLGKEKAFKSSQSGYEVTHLNINSYQSDFAPMYYDSLIMFVSARKKQGWVPRSFNWDESSFLDYYIFYPEIGTSEVSPVESLNSGYHEGPGQLFDQGKQLIFTRNNLINGSKLGRQSDGISKLQIYFAERNGEGAWEKVTPWEHNITAYSFGHPTITQNGDTMIFVSDMPGGLGETDIYISYRTDTTWSLPQNLGEHVNTYGREMFPFLNNDQLYFASDTWPGLGGLDLFVVPFLSDKEPQNLMAPMNSSQDDFSLITRDNGTTGYFASDRNGQDDIYNFESKFIEITVHVINKSTGEDIAGACVWIDKDQKDPKCEVTDSLGQARFRISDTSIFKTWAASNGLIGSDTIGSNSSESLGGRRLIELEMTSPQILLRIFDEDSVTQLTDGVHYVRPLVSSQTLRPLKNEFEYLINPGEEYEVFANAKGHYAARDTFKVPNDVREVFHVDLYLKKVLKGEKITLENIYYDLNSASLRKESEKELDKLVHFMMDNEEIKIELGSHTDSRGSDSYNLELSQKRAESAVAYLLSQGIDSSRIIPKGYGETQLVNNCEDGIQCSSEEHQRNRRTEIKIL